MAHLQHQSIAELCTAAAVAAAVEAAEVAAAKAAREAAMKTAARRAPTPTFVEQLTAFRAANAADAATEAAKFANTAPTAAEGAQSMDGAAPRGTSKPHPVRFSELLLRPPAATLPPSEAHWHIMRS